MAIITANATLNLKEVPATLIVQGTIETYHSNDRITIKRAVPQGINPTILILNLTIIEGNGPMKGTLKAFRYKTSKIDAQTIKQITIQNGLETLITVDVVVFG